MSDVAGIIEDVIELQDRVSNIEQRECIDLGARTEIDYAINDVKKIQRKLDFLINLLIENDVLSEEDI